MMVEIVNREDGRIEVRVDGLVRYCGYNETTAQYIAKRLGGPTLEPRAWQDEMLPRAIACRNAVVW